MQLLKRVSFYLLGVVLGVPLVIFMWKGKNATFDYGPNSRTLKTIRKKRLVYTEAITQAISNKKVDSSDIAKILQDGDVIFSKSKPRKKPCAEYYISSDKIDIYVTRCDSTSSIDKIWLKDKD